MRLQSKILLLLVPLIVVPLTAVGTAAYRQLLDSAEQNRLGEMELVLRQAGARFESELRTVIANTGLFASSFLVEKYALTTDEGERYALLQRPLLSLFASYQAAYPQYYEMRFILPDGYESARRDTRRTRNLTEEEAGDPFVQLLGNGDREVAATIRTNPDNGELALYAGKPLYMRDSSVDPLRAPEILRGYLVVTADLARLQALVGRQRLGENGRLLLVDASGRRHFAQDTAGAAADSKLTGSIPEQQLTALMQALQGKRLIDLAGVQTHVLGVELFPELYLFATLPDEELHAATKGLGKWVAVVTTGTILVFAVLLLALLRRLVITPLAQLDRASHDIAHGHLDVQIDVPGNDEIARLARSFTDMSRSLAESHEQVRYLAYHDSLTGLPNRHMFKQYLAHGLAYAKRHDEPFALLFLDVDEFKQVNDTLGHDAGDQLLEEIADRLSASLRASDILARSADAAEDRPSELVARLGGDEFTVLLPGVGKPAQAAAVAGRILEDLEKPFVISRNKFYVGGSIGITLYPRDGASTDELIRNADLAMYQAKNSGKNTYRFYEAAMNAVAMRRVQMEQRLRQAVERGDFLLHYQPLVDLRDGTIHALEALVRWQDSDTGQLVAPDEFIPLAEETGLIVPIGQWVMQEACRQAKVWRDTGLPAVQMSVNASSVQLGKEDLARITEGVLQSTGLPAEALELELTETSVMAAADQAALNLRRVKALGVPIALDDFGTGYSSLSYLRQFAIDKLKIDRSFVREISHQENQRSIIAAIIAMAHTLGLQVVAEGIEQNQELEFLRQHGCDFAQGYLFSRPLPAAEVEPLLRRQQAFARMVQVG